MEGETRTIAVGNRSLDAYATVHRSGTGPGLLLLADEAGLDAGMRARADLFGEEGYAVLAVAGLSGPDEVCAAAETLRAMRERTGGIAVLGHGPGGDLACRAAAAFDAAVAFDPSGPEDASEIAGGSPALLLFGTRGSGEAEARAGRIESGLDRADGSGVIVYPGAPPGFAVPHRESFDKRTDSLAHSRALGLLRRVLGPHYDLVALFEAHVRHEFETRDVDATMATMIDEPYVNHVPTLAGGVGHDMLKRFYKYHFVHQNSRERSSTPVSETIGPDRIVLETVVRFRHDRVLDRYFPGIPPTGKVVEIPTLLLVKFRGDRVCHEHIYWDQASALKQIGALDADGLPVAGAEAAAKVLDETLPSNIFMQDAWAESESKPI